ncbi:MAG: hypothetical protein JWP67_946 [Mucilaginibacter sp.]|nr:hypothetical protein [Mucilaginibacter sp.]
MKPDQQQIKLLQNYLHETLTYRETYEEIYDHILTALEHQPDNISYQDVINNIICNDFGDHKNLLKIEKISKEALVKESFSKYVSFFLGYFKFHGLIYTATYGLLMYYFLTSINLGVVAFVSIVLIVTVVVPGVIIMVRLFNTGYFLDTTRKSARDKMFENFAGGPVRVLIALHAWIFITSSGHFYKMSVYGAWYNLHPYSITIILMLCTIYNLALYKLYKDEFKTLMAQ